METPSRLLKDRGHLSRGHFYIPKLSAMYHNTTPRQSAARWARVKDSINRVRDERDKARKLRRELRQARQERSAAISFILTLRKWSEFEQFVNLTCNWDYERLESEIINKAREAYQRQMEFMMRHEGKHR